MHYPKGHFKGHYTDWNKVRIDFIFSMLKEEHFQNKSVLEIGCGLADLGVSFWEKGCKVHSVDGRQEHIARCRELHKDKNGMTFEQVNLEKEVELDKYDIVLHLGVLYHLPDVDKSIREMSEICKDIMILETEVSDSDDPEFCLKINEHRGYDQSMSGVGSRPSADYVERLLSENGFDFVRYDSESLNSSIHHYDWVVKNTKSWKHGRRRFWICKRK